LLSFFSLLPPMARFSSAFWLNVFLAVCVAGQSTVTQPPESIIPDPTGAPLPLTQYTFQYPDLPEQVNPFPVGRGPQSGYNVCNSTTEGPDSRCQTMFINSIQDFCLWGSPTPNGLIGNVEASVVAYCTDHGHGTRIIPEGTITSLQFMRTSAYIQVTGQFNQTGVGLDPTDYGGELDPHGADLAGNPLGGIIFSSNLPTTNGKITQVNNWNLFVGSGFFCFKACDNSITSPNYCQNIYDLIGCTYNMPSSAYTENIFEDCQGDLQEPAGLYVVNGTTMTWKQPASLTPGSTIPWQPSIPASSSCTTYSSAQLFGTPTPTVTGQSGSSGSGSGRTIPQSTGTTSGAISISVPTTAIEAVIASFLLGVFLVGIN